MKNSYAWVAFAAAGLLAVRASGQCTVTNITQPSTTNSSATSCVCETAGQTSCELRPDITVSWKALQSYNCSDCNGAGPTEYAQVCSGGCSGNDGRLRITGATPNIGHGPLNFRGVDRNGYRWFICGSDTLSLYDPSSSQTFACPGGATTHQLVVQRVYKKQGNSMQFTERFAGTMTYHPAHGHNHVDDWVTFTLRLEIPGEPNPLNWPIVGSGAKVGFCLMDYYACNSSSGNGHCRTSQVYPAQGTTLTSSSQFPNFGLGGQAYSCNPVSQGISSGWEDVYSEYLDGMWITIPPGTCNGNYWIVAQVDPLNNFVEENEGNNWTAIPFTLTQQNAANSGGVCGITSDKDPVICSGENITLSCLNAGYSYLWNTGATTRSITVSQGGNYSVTVTNPCGTMVSAPYAVTVLNASTPTTTGASLSAPGQASLSATGNNITWYSAPAGGDSLGTGNTFTTPVISQTTTYYASSRAVQPGISAYVGKASNSGTSSYSSNDEYLVFDAYKDLTINSVRVYAQSAGARTFQVLAEDGSFVAQTTVNLTAGSQRANLNLFVPQGNNRRLYVTSTLRALYRNSSSSGVNFPYTVPNVISIKTTNVGVAAYPYCYDWQVSTAAKVCASARVAAVATVTIPVQLTARVLLDGAYVTEDGLMRDNLRTLAQFPMTEPYTAAGFVQAAGGGGETTNASTLGVSGNSAVVDWVLVELRHPSTPSLIVATRCGLLLRNGSIVSTGGGPLSFGVGGGNYYVAVRHRNHLGCMTSTPMTLSPSPIPVDFTSPSTTTWGTTAERTVGTVRALWSGNTVQNGVVTYTGDGNDRDPILTTIGGIVPNNSVFGYFMTDTNLDGVVKYIGEANDRDPILVNIGGVVPTNTLFEQLP